ncbi:NAD-dependent epimerase/dehydratase family protein [Novosphingobium sp. G106]|uniref:NAD-dependent epimerase/dehydratase family protein n=1 Tax=Novosphingobium sp. G106 TaxID=2849500 RepID=UPI001C2DBAD7|nr:NAD-dependent epimerase/dehydratase family protein [Novosphingobium sp. G106]MBV1687848.1 NAD-dependent epimerase/dehydratase family protein [Novosphingobium sp. G106]
MSSERSHLLVAGASGVIGSAATEHFAQMSGWRVTALSRRRPVVDPGCDFDHAAVDLGDAAACATLVDRLPPVTHLIYAAVSEAPDLAPGWRDPERMAQNDAMFANLLTPLLGRGSLEHVSLLQGAKAYGAHVHPVTVPLREESPRDPHANFYWLHEDRLRAAAARDGFGFTIFRPQILLGWAPGAAMNPVAAIGAYAALCRELGLPFVLPASGNALWEMVDAGLLAQAMAWAARTPAAAGEIFNITNGDTFVLRHAWPDLARRCGLGEEGPAPSAFRAFFAAHESQAAWQAIARRHDLAEHSLAALLGQSDVYLDLLGSRQIAEKASPVLLSTIKLRQAGFDRCRDSLESLLLQLERMIALRLLPPIFA